MAAFTWRDLKAHLEGNFLQGFTNLLTTDYPQLANIGLPDGQYDGYVEDLLLEAENHKRLIEVEQIIGRLQNKPCFLAENRRPSDGANNDFSLSSKYQLLARYYFYRGNREKFAEVIGKSVIREWLTKLEGPAAFESQYATTEKYVDRQPLILKLKEKPIRKQHPSYRLRILALRSDDLKPGFVYSGTASTWLTERTSDGGWATSGDGQVIELVRQGEGPLPEIDAEPMAKGTKRPGPSCTGTAKKGAGASFDNSIPSFVCQFKLSEVEREEQFWPKGRSVDSFISSERSSDNVAFAINNVALSPRKGNRKDARAKYTFASAISFSMFFYGRPLHIDIGADRPNTSDHISFIEPIRSMEFEATSNMSKHLETIFPFIWRIMRSYYELHGEYAQIDQLPQRSRKGAKTSRDEEDFLYWKHIRNFVEHYFQKAVDAPIRKLIDCEVRTVQSMILWRRFMVEFQNRNGRPNSFEPAQRREIEQLVIGRKLKEVNGKQDSWLDTLVKETYSKSIPDDFKIYKEDFTSKSVRLSTLETLDFSIYDWFHGIEEVLSGPQLHTEKSKMTPHLFNRCVLTLRSRLSAITTMVDILGKNMNAASQENVMLIRFNEFVKGGLVIHFADFVFAHNELRFGRLATPTFGYVDAKALLTKRMRVTDVNNNARIAGVMDENRKEASGLYVFLRRAYPLHFPRIVERIGTQPSPVFSGAQPPVAASPQTPTIPKRTATIVHVVAERTQTNNPVYDFTLLEAPNEECEVDPEQGPANRPVPTLNTNNIDLTLNPTTIPNVIEGMNSISIGVQQQQPYRNMTELQYEQYSVVNEFLQYPPLNGIPNNSLTQPGPSIGADYVDILAEMPGSQIYPDSNLEIGNEIPYTPNQDIAGQPFRQYPSPK